MKTWIHFIWFLIFTMIGGCVNDTNVRSEKIYTDKERSMLGLCVALADTAMYIAQQKLMQRPKQELVDYYNAQKNARIKIATLEKVYEDEFSNVWDYSTHFFVECGPELAKVGIGRMRPAAECAQNSFIAAVAFGFKREGYPKEEAYNTFKHFEGAVPGQVIDRVYASNEERVRVLTGEWDRCMDNL